MSSTTLIEGKEQDLKRTEVDPQRIYEEKRQLVVAAMIAGGALIDRVYVYLGEPFDYNFPEKELEYDSNKAYFIELVAVLYRRLYYWEGHPLDDEDPLKPVYDEIMAKAVPLFGILKQMTIEVRPGVTWLENVFEQFDANIVTIVSVPKGQRSPSDLPLILENFNRLLTQFSIYLTEKGGRPNALFYRNLRNAVNMAPAAPYSPQSPASPSVLPPSPSPSPREKRPAQVPTEDLEEIPPPTPTSSSSSSELTLARRIKVAQEAVLSTIRGFAIGSFFENFFNNFFEKKYSGTTAKLPTTIFLSNWKRTIEIAYTREIMPPKFGLLVSTLNSSNFKKVLPMSEDELKLQLLKLVFLTQRMYLGDPIEGYPVSDLETFDPRNYNFIQAVQAVTPRFPGVSDEEWDDFWTPAPLYQPPPQRAAPVRPPTRRTKPAPKKQLEDDLPEPEPEAPPPPPVPLTDARRVEVAEAILRYVLKQYVTDFSTISVPTTVFSDNWLKILTNIQNFFDSIAFSYRNSNLDSHQQAIIKITDAVATIKELKNFLRRTETRLPREARPLWTLKSVAITLADPANAYINFAELPANTVRTYNYWNDVSFDISVTKEEKVDFWKPTPLPAAKTVFGTGAVDYPRDEEPVELFLPPMSPVRTPYLSAAPRDDFSQKNRVRFAEQPSPSSSYAPTPGSQGYTTYDSATQPSSYYDQWEPAPSTPPGSIPEQTVSDDESESESESDSSSSSSSSSESEDELPPVVDTQAEWEMFKGADLSVDFYVKNCLMMFIKAFRRVPKDFFPDLFFTKFLNNSSFSAIKNYLIVKNLWQFKSDNLFKRLTDFQVFEQEGGLKVLEALERAFPGSFYNIWVASALIKRTYTRVDLNSDALKREKLLKVEAIVAAIGFRGHFEINYNQYIVNELLDDTSVGPDPATIKSIVNVNQAFPFTQENNVPLNSIEASRKAISRVLWAFFTEFRANASPDQLAEIDVLKEEFVRSVNPTDQRNFSALKQYAYELAKRLDPAGVTPVFKSFQHWCVNVTSTMTPCLVYLYNQYPLRYTGDFSLEDANDLYVRTGEYDSICFGTLNGTWANVRVYMHRQLILRFPGLKDHPSVVRLGERAPETSSFSSFHDQKLEIMRLAEDYSMFIGRENANSMKADAYIPVTWYQEIPSFALKGVPVNEEFEAIRNRPVPDRAAFIEYVSRLLNTLGRTIDYSVQLNFEQWREYLADFADQLDEDNAVVMARWLSKPNWYVDFSDESDFTPVAASSNTKSYQKFLAVPAFAQYLKSKGLVNDYTNQLSDIEDIDLAYKTTIRYIQDSTEDLQDLAASVQAKSSLEAFNPRRGTLQDDSESEDDSGPISPSPEYLRFEVSPFQAVSPSPEPFTSPQDQPDTVFEPVQRTLTPWTDPLINFRWTDNSCPFDSLIFAFLYVAANYALHLPKDGIFKAMFKAFRQNPKPDNPTMVAALTQKRTELAQKIMGDEYGKMCDPAVRLDKFIEHAFLRKDPKGNPLRIWDYTVSSRGADGTLITEIPAFKYSHEVFDVISINQTIENLGKYQFPFEITVNQTLYRLTSAVFYNEPNHYTSMLFMCNQSPSNFAIDVGTDHYMGNQIWHSNPHNSDNFYIEKASTAWVQNNDQRRMSNLSELKETYFNSFGNVDNLNGHQPLICKDFLKSSAIKPVIWIYMRVTEEDSTDVPPSNVPPSKKKVCVDFSKTSSPPIKPSSSSVKNPTRREETVVLSDSSQEERLSSPPLQTKEGELVDDLPLEPVVLKPKRTLVPEVIPKSPEGTSVPKPKRRIVPIEDDETEILQATPDLFAEIMKFVSEDGVVRYGYNQPTEYDSKETAREAALNPVNVVPANKEFKPHLGLLPAFDWDSEHGVYDALYGAFLLPYVQYRRVASERWNILKSLLWNFSTRPNPDELLGYDEDGNEINITYFLAGKRDRFTQRIYDPVMQPNVDQAHVHLLLQYLFRPDEITWGQYHFIDDPETKVYKYETINKIVPTYRYVPVIVDGKQVVKGGKKLTKSILTGYNEIEVLNLNVFDHIIAVHSSRGVVPTRLPNLISFSLPIAKRKAISRSVEIPFIHRYGSQIFRLSSVIYAAENRYKTVMFVHNQKKTAAQVRVGDGKYMANGVWELDTYMDPVFRHLPVREVPPTIQFFLTKTMDALLTPFTAEGQQFSSLGLLADTSDVAQEIQNLGGSITFTDVDMLARGKKTEEYIDDAEFIDPEDSEEFKESEPVLSDDDDEDDLDFVPEEEEDSDDDSSEEIEDEKALVEELSKNLKAPTETTLTTRKGETLTVKDVIFQPVMLIYMLVEDREITRDSASSSSTKKRSPKSPSSTISKIMQRDPNAPPHVLDPKVLTFPVYDELKKDTGYLKAINDEIQFIKQDASQIPEEEYLKLFTKKLQIGDLPYVLESLYEKQTEKKREEKKEIFEDTKEKEYFQKIKTAYIKSKQWPSRVQLIFKTLAFLFQHPPNIDSDDMEYLTRVTDIFMHFGFFSYFKPNRVGWDLTRRNVLDVSTILYDFFIKDAPDQVLSDDRKLSLIASFRNIRTKLTGEPIRLRKALLDGLTTLEEAFVVLWEYFQNTVANQSRDKDVRLMMLEILVWLVDPGFADDTFNFNLSRASPPSSSNE